MQLLLASCVAKRSPGYIFDISRVLQPNLGFATLSTDITIPAIVYETNDITLKDLAMAVFDKFSAIISYP